MQPLTADCENPRLAINLGRVTDSSLTSPTVPLDFPGSLSGFSSAHAPGRDALPPGACEASVAWLATMGAAAGDAETGTDNQVLSEYNIAHWCGNRITDEKQFEKSYVEPLKFVTNSIGWMIDESYGTQTNLLDFFN